VRALELEDLSMTNMIPVSPSRHADKGWHSPSNLAFASSQAGVPLVGAEFAKAAISMPIAFAEQAGRFFPLAVMSPIVGQNLFIGPGGQWLGGYVPAALRSYPFGLSRAAGAEEFTLYIDEDSGLVVEPDGTSQPFFGADGKPSAAVKAVMASLGEFERNRSRTEMAIAALAEVGVIEPWSLQMRVSGQVTPVGGLFRTSQAAINALDDAAFLKLRHAGVLPLAYMQLLSMSQMPVFDNLSLTQQQLAQTHQQRQIASLDEIFERASGETLRFN
jgi:hypothetical protein